MLIRILAIVALLAPLVVASTQTAAACSCAIGDPQERIERAHTAFVGRVISHTELDSKARWSSDDLITLTFEVEAVVDGEDVGQQVNVLSTISTCSFGERVFEGDRVGILTWLDVDGNYRSGLCSTMDPDVMLATGAPLGAPDGEGPLKYLVGGSFQSARVMGLDAQGRVLAYGLGTETTGAIALCPGGERAIEAYPSDDGRLMLATRDLQSFDLVDAAWSFFRVDESRVGEHADVRFAPVNKDSDIELECRNPEGTSAAFFFTDYDGEGNSALVTTSSTPELSTQVLWKGNDQGAAFSADGSVVYIATMEWLEAGRTDHDVYRFDLETGEQTQLSAPSLHRFEQITSMAVSPDHSTLAILVSGTTAAGVGKLFLVDTVSTTSPVKETSVHLMTGSSSAVWTDDQHIMVVTSNDEHETPVYDLSLDLVDHMPPGLSLIELEYSGGHLHGLGFSGWIDSLALVSIDPESGAQADLKRFDRNAVHALAVTDSDVVVEQQGQNGSQPVSLTNGSSDSGADSGPGGISSLSAAEIAMWSAVAIGGLAVVALGAFTVRRTMFHGRRQSGQINATSAS